MTRQLAFDLPVREAFLREDFFTSPANAAALAALAGGQSWPAGKMLLVGPAGSGKSHLAHIWTAEHGAKLIDARDLVGADLPALAAHGAVAVEDADRIAGDRAAETALFHLHNLLIQTGQAVAGRLLITATTPPRDWGLILPDLQSRMQAASLTRIAPPDDALMSAVLIKLFSDRQIAVPPNLIPYLVQRIERSIDAARDVVAKLDGLALALGRPVTRALAAAYMGPMVDLDSRDPD